MSRRISRWLAGAMLAGGLMLAGCSPAARNVDTAPHVRGEPVSGPTFSRLLYPGSSTPEYYASEAEMKLALQRKAQAYGRPATAPE